MDGAALAAVETSAVKARTAVLFAQPTRDLAAAAGAGAPLFTTEAATREPLAFVPVPDADELVIGAIGAGGRPDAMQLMVYAGRAYIGHLFSAGFSVLDIADPHNVRPVHFEAAPQRCATALRAICNPGDRTTEATSSSRVASDRLDRSSRWDGLR